MGTRSGVPSVVIAAPPRHGCWSWSVTLDGPRIKRYGHLDGRTTRPGQPANPRRAELGIKPARGRRAVVDASSRGGLWITNCRRCDMSKRTIWLPFLVAWFL